MINESQIRQHLASFLAGKERLDDFEDWLTQHSWNMHKDSEQRAQDLVSDIELRLSEHSSGYLSENELRKELAGLAKNVKVLVETGASSVTVVRHVSIIHGINRRK